MDILVDYACAEIEIKKSRFLAEVFPVTTQQNARILLKQQKEKYEDATHVVHAFAVGNNAEILGMSDDGEPAGTAGRPVLDVLKGKNCTNILLTVTRWFGGTLLGTGGLVKAYGDSAKAVLEVATFEPFIPKKEFHFSISYDVYDQIKRFLTTLKVFDIEEKFDTSIHIKGLISDTDVNILLNSIKNITNGQILVKIN